MTFTLEVKKYNKRLYILVVETGELYYTPPDFIYSRMGSRQPLQNLANRMTCTPYENWFDCIFEFEAGFTK